MKIGFIISMYDEIEDVSNNIEFLKKENCPIIVIQSHPPKEYLILDKTKVDHYELLPDLAGSKENYMSEWKTQREKGGKITTVPARALARNFSHGFTASRNFDVDWWVAILGDMKVTNLIGIKKIIQKMENLDKYVGVTRGVGLKFPNEEGMIYNRIQRDDTTDFFPQFFLASSKLVKNGLYNDIKITNPYGSEIVLGDNLLQYCKDNGLKFWNVCYSICDYPAPKWIEGLDYNPDRTLLPSFLLGPMNWFRRVRMRLFY